MAATGATLANREAVVAAVVAARLDRAATAVAAAGTNHQPLRSADRQLWFRLCMQAVTGG